ncbi:MAG: hypothetical protein O3C20_24335 [Verrucomicrobia bacterium]|nr:hypothetical protein [Verrucomicrobiota bacterium]
MPEFKDTPSPEDDKTGSQWETGTQQSSEQKPESVIKNDSSFWAELKRRKVMRVAITYAVVAWLIIQVANATFGSFGIPEWAYRFVVIMLVCFFPVAVILAWAFELTPDGIKTTKHAREEQGEAPVSQTQERKRNWMAFAFAAAVPTLIFGTLALIFFFRSSPDATDPSSLASSPSSPELVEFAKSIAVLPFTNMSEDAKHAYFADGVHETILTNLANLGDLRVVSRTSVMQYRDTDKPIPEIGVELKVAYILEGSMQRAGNQFKLTAQLIETAKDNHLWAEDFTGELTDIFTVQAQLAKKIASALQAVLTPQEEQQLDRPETASIEAYDLYLQALENFKSNGVNVQGIELLEKAVELDPAFTDAWLQIVRTKGFRFVNGLDRAPEYEGEIKHAVDTAIRLEPNNPKVILALAQYYYNSHLDFARARFYIDQVVEKLPQSAQLQAILASVDRREGRWAECISHFQRALLLDPKFNGVIENLAETYGKIRDWEKAGELWDSLLANQSIRRVWRYEEAQNHFYATGSLEEGNKLFSEAGSNKELENLSRLWLYQTGNVQAFTADEIADTWKKNPDDVGSLEPWDFTVLHQAIVLTALKKFEPREALLNSILEAIKQRGDWSTEDFKGQLSLGLVQALKGNIEEAQRAIDLAVAIRPESADALRGNSLAAERAIVLAWMGKKDEATKELIRLSKKPNNIINYHNLKNSLSFLPLRDHPGFQALLNDPALKEPLPVKNQYP